MTSKPNKQRTISKNIRLFFVCGFIGMNLILSNNCQNKRQEKVDELAKQISKRIYDEDEPIKYDNVNDETCKPEREFILSQTKRIEKVISHLEENYEKLSIQEFEAYLTQWNRDIEKIRDDIDKYNYQCFKYVGIKGLGTLAMQLGLGYINVVMYNDKSDIIQVKRRIVDKVNEIHTSLEAIK